MNLQALMAAVVLCVAGTVCGFWYGTNVGRDGEIAKQAAVDKATADTRKLAMEGAADAISKIVVRNTTVQGRVETIVRDNPVYRDCSHPADVVRNINEALTGRAGPAGNRGVPGADPAE
ncbi:hypothetical protein GJV26_15950 [Massilia dura]|uniref:Uncharacterized protein n=1 Tax=Pseudoduganella dura TaxID=321982 RepID=A0A6I3XQ91_9BURK|nr:hypothetical protein [Pseudoduganella dura]MUI13935.1 hypothetical protein [Pseudoduganella dura]GGX98982.1 hypothetical protein GCM10007386_32360 [Pseudoduganella dura]